MRRRWVTWTLLLVLGLGLIQMGRGGWIHAKAVLAQILLEAAWADGGASVKKPWPWADFHPVAKLTVPRLKVTHLVLSHDRGAALAFGPGLHPGGAGPGEAGTVLLSGHRDTHFRFLREIEPGDLILLEAAGGVFRYRVSALAVMDVTREAIRPDPTRGSLILATCWPFDALRPGGPLRLLATARLEADKPAPPPGRLM